MSCRNTEKLVCKIFVSSFSCASSLFLFGNQTNGILFLGNVVKSSNGCIKGHDASFASKIKLNIFSCVSTNSIYSMKLSIFRLGTCTESNGICHLEHIATLMSYVNDTTFWWTKQANNAIFHANCSVTKTQFQTFLSCWIVCFTTILKKQQKATAFEWNTIRTRKEHQMHTCQKLDHGWKYALDQFQWNEIIHFLLERTIQINSLETNYDQTDQLKEPHRNMFKW